MGVLTVTRRDNKSICLLADPECSLESLREALLQGIVITIRGSKHGQCKVQIDAPEAIEILRTELIG